MVSSETNPKDIGQDIEETDDRNPEQDDDSSSDVSDTSDEESADEDQEIGNSSDDDEVDGGNRAEGAAEEEEDEVIKAIRRENNRVRNHPPPIQLDDFVVDLSFHPQQSLLAVASITGDVMLYDFTNEENTLRSTLELHTKACRDVEFSEDGNTIFSTSKDKTIMLSDTATEKLLRFYDNSHESPINCIRVLSDNLFASGDDDGCLKLWDLREKADKPIFRMKKNEDYISDIVSNESLQYLVCSSGDGSLSALDIGQRKFFMQSEPYEEELTSLGLFRSETKVLAASSRGKLYLYNWREFGLHSDAYPGPNVALNRIVPITENIVVSGGEDGTLRATHLFPHRHLGVVGEHQLSVDSLDISGDGTLIASSGHDGEIKFWNIEYFADFERATATKQTRETRKRELEYQLPSSKRRNVSDFFSDL